MSGFNASFADALHRDMDGSDAPLRKTVSELVKNREVERLFPERDGLWLQKELSKWRGKLSDDRFNGTLRSLEIYCTLKGVTPNDVLLPKGTYSGLSRIEFLGGKTILSLAKTIRDEEIVIPHGLALSVLYAPDRMTAVFLFLYPRRSAGADTVFLRFGISEPEGFADEEDGSGAITTALDSSLYVTDLSRSDWEDRLRRAYRKILGEFEGVCGAAESPLRDAVNEFYDRMGVWTTLQNPAEDALFAWYPPVKKPGKRPTALDELTRKPLSAEKRER